MTVAASCEGQPEPQPSREHRAGPSANAQRAAAAAEELEVPDVEPSFPDPVVQEVQSVVRRTFQDSKGDLWFGGDGASRYDGESLRHFPLVEGRGVSIRAITEDQAGNVLVRHVFRTVEV